MLRIDRELKQGESLSPLLLVIFMDNVLTQCKRTTKRTKIGNWRLRQEVAQALVYANNTVIVIDSAQEFQAEVTEWVSTLRDKSIELNASKSKDMWVGKERNGDESCGEVGGERNRRSKIFGN